MSPIFTDQVIQECWQLTTNQHCLTTQKNEDHYHHHHHHENGF